MEYYLGEIKLFPYNRILPAGWTPCEGQELLISSNQALYSLLSNRYGGNGTTHFNLPDYRGTVPVGQGENGFGTYELGTRGGAESTQLAQVPAHSHYVQVFKGVGTENDPTGQLLAATVGGGTGGESFFSTEGTDDLAPATVGSTGAGKAFTNIQPSIALRYCIATSGGVYPPRS
ncbi:MAG: phage tail protein [Alphaproteobacteria bacterium]|nr:MAG: phage tail protein [Alphaproteobacteria bacterium]